jgi:hypothetical protein
MWVIPMREYNEDPTFSSLVSPTTFAARRRTIYVFFDKCAAAGRVDPGDGSCIERIALGGTSQGGLYEAVRSTRAVEAAVGGRQAELWGDAQWQVLKDVIEQRKPTVIGINTSRVFAFADGLSSGELEGMARSLGTEWTGRVRPAENLPVEFIAARLPEEEAFYGRLQALVGHDQAGHYAHERPGLVVAAAGQRPGTRHLVSTVNRCAASWRKRRATGRRSHHPEGGRAAL